MQPTLPCLFHRGAVAPDKAEEYAKNGIAGEWDRLGAQWR